VTVGALYLWEHVNLKLRPKLLRELDPGDRIVSHDFRMGKWEPDTTIHAGRDKAGKAIIHVWTVPEEVPLVSWTSLTSCLPKSFPRSHNGPPGDDVPSDPR